LKVINVKLQWEQLREKNTQNLCRVFIDLMFFLNTICFGKCTGITFIDSTKISVCHNKRIRRNKVFAGIAALTAYCFFDKKTRH
jgi:hypothetical protein